MSYAARRFDPAAHTLSALPPHRVSRLRFLCVCLCVCLCVSLACVSGVYFLPRLQVICKIAFTAREDALGHAEE